MKRVFLGLGSNVGNSQEIVLSALSQISLLKFVCDFQKSPLYRTTPVSDPLQESFMNENFINAVCSFETSEEDPFIVLRCLQQIEKDLGKKRSSETSHVQSISISYCLKIKLSPFPS